MIHHCSIYYLNFGICVAFLNTAYILSAYTCCISLLKYGLYFIGIVKTATRMFPKAFFQAWESTKPPRGATKQVITMTTAEQLQGTPR